MISLNDNRQKTVLPSGLRVVSEHIPTVRSIAIGVWVMAGTRYEEDSQIGISHFLEHMVFKGTKTRSSFDIAHELEAVGGSMNAFTSKEITCYYARVLDENLDVACDILSDILINPTFDQQEFDKEKDVVVEEINSMYDTPDDYIHELFSKAVLPQHPLGRSVLGTRKVVKSITRDALIAYKEKMYSADRIVISAAGNVKHDDLVKMAEKYFTFKTASFTQPRIKETSAITRIDMREKDILQTHLCLGCRGLEYADQDRFKLLMLNSVLGSGMSSRLFQNIREKTGMAYTVFSYLDFYTDAGIFTTYIGTDPDKAERAIGLILKEYKMLMDTSVSEVELQKNRAQVKGSLLMGLENTNSRMNHIARTELYLNRFVDLDELIGRINEISAQDIRDVAARLLGEDHLSLAMLGPKMEKALTESVLQYI